MNEYLSVAKQLIINGNTSVTVTIPVPPSNNNSTVSLLSHTRLFRQNKNVNLVSSVLRFNFPLLRTSESNNSFTKHSVVGSGTRRYMQCWHVTSFDDHKNYNFPLSIAIFLLREGNLIPLYCRPWNTTAQCYPNGSTHVFGKRIGRSARNMPM
jgi:hypothetical protein